MGSRTGLDPVTIAVLGGLAEFEAHSDHQFAKSSRVVANIYESERIPPHIAYDVLVRQGAPWLVNVPLVEHHGNFGAPGEPPFPPEYTEVRLTSIGRSALAAERSDAPKLPISLINGDLALGGTTPPFAPRRVLDALKALLEGDPGDDVILDLLGAPCLPTGCHIGGDVGALVSGDSTTLVLTSDIATSERHGGSRLVISRFPYDVSAYEIAAALEEYVAALRDDDGVQGDQFPPGRNSVLRHELESVQTQRERRDSRIICTLRAGASVGACREELTSVHPIRTTVNVRLEAPLPRVLRDFADSDRTAQHRALAKLA
jgi:DNA gyrase/topoisomerase IV subunit A